MKLSIFITFTSLMLCQWKGHAACLDSDSDFNFESEMERTPALDLGLGPITRDSLDIVLADGEFTSYPEVHLEDEIDFEVDVEKMGKGKFQMARESYRTEDEFKTVSAKAFSALDFPGLLKSSDKALLVVRGAAVIKGKRPSDFSKELYQNPAFLKKVLDFDKVTVTLENGDRRIRVEKSIKLGFITLSTLQADLQVSEYDTVKKTGNMKMENVDTILSFSSSLDKELGTPEKIINVQIDNFKSFGNGVNTVYKFYPVGEDSSLLVFNNMISVKNSALPAPSFFLPRNFIRGPIYKISEKAGADYIDALRKY